MNILAIETSCDDTSVAILTQEPHEPRLAALSVVSQRNIHEKFGGIVPENASRAHLEVLDNVVEEVLCEAGLHLQDIEKVAVTHAPGLLGSLLVGVCYAKSLAATLGIPCLGVHHLEGHLAAPLLALRLGKLDLKPSLDPFPALGVVLSGGHSHFFGMKEWKNYECLGRTLDDAVGECFDKSARLMGLDFPGGPELNRSAVELLHEKGLSLEDESFCEPKKGLSRFSLPRPMPGQSWKANGDMSFSGLKTAIRNLVEKDGIKDEEEKQHLALGIHEAIGEVLLRKTEVALDRMDSAKSIFLTGGVAANSILRRWYKDFCRKRKLELLVAPPYLCTDNAAMIGYAAMLDERKLVEEDGFEVLASLSL